MMGEFIIYYRGKVVGGIYDDRFLVKAVPSAIACMPKPSYELPYKGEKKATGRRNWRQGISNKAL